jgi:hypothetical protein
LKTEDGSELAVLDCLQSDFQTLGIAQISGLDGIVSGVWQVRHDFEKGSQFHQQVETLSAMSFSSFTPFFCLRFSP